MPVGAPKGSANRAKGTQFADAVRVALMTYEATDVPQGQALRKIADTLVKGALEGNMTALQEIANRLDGKPAQQVMLTGEHGGPVQLQTIERKIVDPANPNG